MLNRGGVVYSVAAIYDKVGNGEKVCPTVLTNWVMEVCNPEFKQAKGMSPLYNGEWYWGENPQVTEAFAGVKVLDNSIEDGIEYDFTAVAEFVKWGFICCKLQELNQQSRGANTDGVSYA